MVALIFISLFFIFIAVIIWAISEGEITSAPLVLWFAATVMLFVVAMTNTDPENTPVIKADVPEEYWDGDMQHLEVYKRTPDSIYLRFRTEAYNQLNDSDYQLICTRDSVIIWDGPRRVGSVPYSKMGVEGIILDDNR
jgi:hypothetical protein